MSVLQYEGNIAAGKTTLTAEMVKSYGFTGIEEKMNTLLLDGFYRDPSKYGLVMQLFTIATRRYSRDDAKRQASKGENIVIDRGILGDVVFALVGRSNGVISEEDFLIYKSVVKMYTVSGGVCKNTDRLVYLDVDPKECHNRLRVRGTASESSVPLKYLEQVDEMYFYVIMMLLGGRQVIPGIDSGNVPPVHIIQWDKLNGYGNVSQSITSIRPASVVFSTDTTPQIQTLEQLSTASTSDLSDKSEVSLNWDLRKTLMFRRHVMKILSLGISVVLCEHTK
jgi:deoxyadenosine/deoxycytidine kinase